MICPSCATPNLPGAELCGWCQFDLMAVDRAMASNRVESHLMDDPVGEACPRRLVSVSVDSTLGEAIAKMVSQSVGAVCVTGANGELVGILTERDYLTRVAGAADFAKRPVKQYMTRDPETVASSDPIAFALAKMDVGGYRHLPVTEGGFPVGMISVRDMLKHVLKLCKEGI
jgi:CBS domain-containing protein